MRPAMVLKSLVYFCTNITGIEMIMVRLPPQLIVTVILRERKATVGTVMDVIPSYQDILYDIRSFCIMHGSKVLPRSYDVPNGTQWLNVIKLGPSALMIDNSSSY